MQKLHPDKQIALSYGVVALLLHPYGITEFSYEKIEKGIENTS